MFRIEKDFGDPLLEATDGFEDDFEVLIEGDIQRLERMNIPRLPEDGDGLCPAFDQGLEIRVTVRRNSRPAGASKGNHFGMGERSGFDLSEELEILRVRTWPTPFDIVNPKLI